MKFKCIIWNNSHFQKLFSMIIKKGADADRDFYCIKSVKYQTYIYQTGAQAYYLFGNGQVCDEK